MVPRNNSPASKISSRIPVVAIRTIGCVTLIGAAVLFWQLTRHETADVAPQPVPIAQSAAPQPGLTGPGLSRPGLSPPPSLIVEQASVASIVEVIVGRNDTLDGIFRRMSLNKSDLAAIRALPGIRQSLDFLRPGDAIKLKHSDGDIKELTRKVSETQTLNVVRQDSGFEAKMINNPVEVRVRPAAATIESSLFQAA